MSSCVQRNADVLRLLYKSKPAMVKAILKNMTADQVKALCECILNVLRGNVELNIKQKNRLARYKRIMRALSSKKHSAARRKRLLIQQGGGFLGALLGPVLGVLGSVLGV